MKIISVIFGLFILLVIVLADLGRLPRALHAVYDFPNGDKLGHFILFGLLNFLLTLTFVRSLPGRTPKQTALIVGLSLGLLIGLEELSQKLFATRTFDLLDLSASYLGVLVGGGTALNIGRRQPPS